MREIQGRPRAHSRVVRRPGKAQPLHTQPLHTQPLNLQPQQPPPQHPAPALSRPAPPALLAGLADPPAADPTRATADQTRLTSSCPAGQRTPTVSPSMRRRTSKPAAQVRHRYS